MGITHPEERLVIFGKTCMPLLMVTNVEPLLRLPKKERMEVAERLWLSVADEQRMPVPAAHKSVIKERLQNYKAGKSVPVAHSEMMKRLRAK